MRLVDIHSALGGFEGPVETLTQVGGDHYAKHNIEPLDIVEDWFGADGLRAALTCKVLKYVCRYRDKNGIEDLDKAINCINKLKDMEQ